MLSEARAAVSAQDSPSWRLKRVLSCFVSSGKTSSLLPSIVGAAKWKLDGEAEKFSYKSAFGPSFLPLDSFFHRVMNQHL